MEKRFIQIICPKKPVRLLGCNGDQVAMSAIAVRLQTQLNLMANYYPVVVVFDRENRAESCDELIAELTDQLEKLNVNVDNLIIGIADRTTENWMLADPDCLGNKNQLAMFPGSCEGKHGKGLMKKCLGKRVTYGETTTGVQILKRMNPNTVSERSPSFQKLVSQIEFDCWWTSSEPAC